MFDVYMVCENVTPCVVCPSIHPSVSQSCFLHSFVVKVRLCWEKGELPFLQVVENLMRIKLGIDFEPLYIRAYKHDNEFQNIEVSSDYNIH